MAHEYDCPRLMRTAETWLVGAVPQLLPNFNPIIASSAASTTVMFVRLLSLVRDYKLHRLAGVVKDRMDSFKESELRSLIRAELNEAVK